MKTDTKKYWITIAMVIVIVTGLGGWMITRNMPQFQRHDNFAFEAALPIEKTFVESGARKVCSRGDAGYSSDNQAPNYSAVYETDLSLESATDLITRASTANGFKMNASQSAYPETHSYFDHTTKPSPYAQLESGPIVFALSLYDGGDKLGCSGRTVVYDKEHTAIKLDVALPAVK